MGRDCLLRWRYLRETAVTLWRHMFVCCFVPRMLPTFLFIIAKIMLCGSVSMRYINYYYYDVQKPGWSHQRLSPLGVAGCFREDVPRARVRSSCETAVFSTRDLSQRERPAVTEGERPLIVWLRYVFSAVQQHSLLLRPTGHR